MNYLEKGNKLIYFGIAIGVNYGDYKVVRKPKLDALQTDSIKLISSKFGPGFDLGIIGNLQFHKHFDLRMVPTLSFSDKSLEFTDQDDNKITKSVSSIYLSLPLYLRYKSKPINDFRFFVLGGMRYNFDLNANSNERNNESQILVNRHDIGVEMGFGFQIFFQSFVLSPELKVYHSVSNIKQANEGLIYSRAIDKMFSRIFTLTINLEG
ncbi:MAG: PorT family protein [Chitinophagales bacterium]|nr:PorT family protein [Chitinophagales bacterium]